MDLSETFENLRKFKWKLNLTKCVFGVLSGKLLGFIVSSWGIEANPTKAINNTVEYEALIHGLRIAVTLGIKHLLAYGDSKVIIRQVNKDWECTKEKIDAYCQEIRKLGAKFYSLEFHHIPRDNNVAMDILSKLGSKRSIVPPSVFVQALNSPTVKMEEEPPTKPDLVPAIGQQVLTLDTDWRSPIIDFIKNNKIYCNTLI